MEGFRTQQIPTDLLQALRALKSFLHTSMWSFARPEQPSIIISISVQGFYNLLHPYIYIYIYLTVYIYIYTSMERADAVLGSFACCICFRTWHVCLGFKLEWLSGRPRQVLACDLRSSSGMRVNWRFFLTSPGSQHLAFFPRLGCTIFRSAD